MFRRVLGNKFVAENLVYLVATLELCLLREFFVPVCITSGFALSRGEGSINIG